MKLYLYTILMSDGTKNEMKPRKKMTLEELQRAVGGYIEIIPNDYYKHQKWGYVTVYVNEEERLRNPDALENIWFKNLGGGFNVIGTALKEEIFHG